MSRDCDGCPLLWECSRRFKKVMKGEKVYCPDGTAHLVDDSSASQGNDTFGAQLNVEIINPLTSTQ